MSRVLLVAGLLMMVTGASAFAANDSVGNPGFGKGLANQLCGDCHIVSPDQQFSGGRLGPNLVERARDPGITELALRSYMQTTHPVMPNIMLSQQQTDDIIAYLLTFKGSAR
jgi:mono/diheme cytochrome c family protein